MAPIAALDRIANPLATPEQIIDLRDSDAVNSLEKADSVRFVQSQLTQAAGVLLRIPQEIISQAIILITRFWLAEGWSASFAPKTISAAALYTIAKVSFTPVSPRSVINVYAYLLSEASELGLVDQLRSRNNDDPHSYFVSEGTYERERNRLFICESTILKALGFNIHVALPHKLALTYMQALGTASSLLARRVVEHLNGALFSPQMVYLTHQPNALAVAAIYLAARETGIKLVDGNWWEVFDVDREDLGFLIVAFGCLQAFAETEREKWQDKHYGLDLLDSY
ncbi:MAG: hypothetical protein Q9227_002959 [Pyrenula ochraceoflavens]